ncbi:MAG TPA: HlyD family type I secretion periplasmic adaptor subunit [Nitrospira sp.]|nr:HlyD family type I secretion periplasmic adaptor subunit [Nitrospira sp.]
MAFDTVTRHWTVWKAAWQGARNDFHTAGRAVPKREGTWFQNASSGAKEFLPAVLEVQQTPPSPIGRAIVWTILIVFTTGTLWATFGWIDIVAIAQGKILASGYSKTIQPYETGVIAAIYVMDGQVVRAGDVLIDLDPTLNRADRDRASNDYRAAKVDAARLRALVAGQSTFEAPPDGDPTYIALQRELLLDQVAEHQARVQAAQHVIDQRRAAIDQTAEDIHRLEATVLIERERAETYKALLQYNAATKMEYLQAEEQRIDRTQELAGQRMKLIQDRAALAESEKNYRALISEFQQTKQAELSTIETKAASLAQDVTKAGQKALLQRLTAPIDGVVQQLAVHTLGGVVTPAQQLLIVVPQDQPAEAEAQVENKDVGFVREGQPVEIKVETFPFTLYGTIPGSVLTVSDDAVPLDRDKANTDKPSQLTAAERLVYATRVRLQRSTIEVNGKTVNLAPGMAVIVEIKTGKRRIIEYLLSPLLKSIKESLRER